ncbi:MAG: sensor histidine kinase [Caldilineaceae bacterium]|nr:sensor histidine kinase [Caldilineaceae bacterium]
MDKRVRQSQGITETDLALFHRMEAGLPLTADISRADILLCTLLDRQQALVARHVMPQSTPSLYRRDITGDILTPDEHQQIFRALRTGNGGRSPREVLSNGAPIIQDIYPIETREKRFIGALVFETNMVAHERHRRRNRSFRQAVRWLQEMCLRGELENTANLSRFDQYDGSYLVDSQRKVVYMSGIAANLYRSIGILSDIRDQSVSSLEALDVDLVEQVFQTQSPVEVRRESDDGRIWVRTLVPVSMPSVSWQNYWQTWGWYSSVPRVADDEIAAVLVLIHNATDAVLKQRELNVKSAIIQEVHHRVKNNLQTIAAMMRIQARRCETDEARQVLTDAVNRILSMSVIHEFLSQDEHQPINIRELCQRIAGQVLQVAVTPEQQIDITVDGPNIRLPAGQATPTAMVVNELLLNAMEHGVSERQTGRIHIELTDLGGAVRITVTDDGLGVPANFDLASSESLGLQIVRTLVTDDLKGEMTITTVERTAEPSDRERFLTGTCAMVTFPKRALK